MIPSDIRIWPNFVGSPVANSVVFQSLWPIIRASTMFHCVPIALFPTSYAIEKVDVDHCMKNPGSIDYHSMCIIKWTYLTFTMQLHWLPNIKHFLILTILNINVPLLIDDPLLIVNIHFVYTFVLSRYSLASNLQIQHIVFMMKNLYLALITIENILV